MAEKIRFTNIYGPNATRIRTLSGTGILNGYYNAQSTLTASKFGTLSGIIQTNAQWLYFAQHGSRVTLDNNNLGLTSLIVTTSSVVFDVWDETSKTYVECHLEDGVDQFNRPYIQWVDSNGNEVNDTEGDNARITGHSTSSSFLVAPIHVGYRLNLDGDCYDAILAMYVSDSSVLSYDYDYDTHGSFMVGSRMMFHTGRNYRQFMPLSGCVKISDNISSYTLNDPIAVQHSLSTGTDIIIE